MGENEHLEVARRLTELADRLYQDGDDVAAAEMLWGAVNRIIVAIALRHQLATPGSQPRRGQVIYHLTRNHIAGRPATMDLQAGLSAPRELHGHFYNSYLDADGIAERVSDTKSFIADLLNLYHQHARR